MYIGKEWGREKKRRSRRTRNSAVKTAILSSLMPEVVCVCWWVNTCVCVLICSKCEMYLLIAGLESFEHLPATRWCANTNTFYRARAGT